VIPGRSSTWPGLLAACGLLAGVESLAQDSDPRASTEDQIQGLNDRKIAVTHWEPSPSTLASTLLQGYALVAAGQFEDLPITADEEAARRPTDITVTFRISRLFKGAPPLPVRIQLSSDMLFFPLANTSRYAWRQELRGKQIAEEATLNASAERLTEKLSTGSITRQQYEIEQEQLTAARKRLVQESLRTSTRQVRVIDGNTFYDLGGSLRPDELYLIGVNATAGGTSVYVLEESPKNGTNVLWGETMTDVTKALDEAAR
jgi:hypothetical protein